MREILLFTGYWGALVMHDFMEIPSCMQFIIHEVMTLLISNTYSLVDGGGLRTHFWTLCSSSGLLVICSLGYILMI